MELELEIDFAKACPKDLEEILVLQKIAYISEAKLIDDYSIPPLQQSFEELKEEFREMVFFKGVINDTIVGSVRACIQNETCYIGKLIVHPNYQNSGMGARLLAAVEGFFSEAHRYDLFTGEKSTKNIYFYQKYGYEIYDKTKISNKLTLVFMEKVQA